MLVNTHHNLVCSSPVTGIVRSGDSIRQVSPEISLVYTMSEECNPVIRDVCEMSEYHYGTIVVYNRDREELPVQLMRS